MTRVGVVGCGYWGSKHVRVLNELQGSQGTIVVCDTDPTKLDRIRFLYPAVEITANYDDLLDRDLDAVIVAAPVNTHSELAKKAILRGKHVLVEKPLSTSVESAQELVELADARGLVLMPGHTYLYHPAVDFLRDLLSSGDLGELYYINSSRLNLGMFQPDVDVLWDLAPHDISILLYLMGQDPGWVNAQGTAHVNPTQFEVCYLGLGFPEQVLGHIHVSWLDPCKVRLLTIVGSRRMVVFDDVAPAEQVRIYDKGVSVSHNAYGNGGREVLYRHGEVKIPFIQNEEPLKREVNDFLECIASGGRPRSDGREALRVISILQAAHESLADGGRKQWVEMPRDPGRLPKKENIPALPIAGR